MHIDVGGGDSGIFIENGGGGLIADSAIEGGQCERAGVSTFDAAVLAGICLYAACSCHEMTEWKRPGADGIQMGGQQWMLRSVTIARAAVMGVLLNWDWDFTFLDMTFESMPIGIGGETGGVQVVSITLVDTTFSDVTIGISSKFPAMSSIVLDRAAATGSTECMRGRASPACLPPRSRLRAFWLRSTPARPMRWR
jgi:hypothetical protein